MAPVANTLKGMKLKYIHKIIFNCPFWFCNLVAFQRRWEKSPLSSCNRWSYVVTTKQVWPMTYGKIPAGCATGSHWSSAAMYPWYSLLWPRPLHSVSCSICSWKPRTAGFLLQARLPLQLLLFPEVHAEANIWCLASCWEPHTPSWLPTAEQCTLSIFSTFIWRNEIMSCGAYLLS